MSSRLARDPEGKPIVVDHEGRRYRVVGDQVAAGGTEITFMSVKTGERMPKRAPVVPSSQGPDADGWVVGDVAE